MSKYIRFINAYNDNKEELLNVSEYWHKDSDGGYSIDGYTIYGREVIKEADTIEELCDHLVVIEKGSSILPHIQHRFLGDLFIDHSYDEKFQQNKLIVYGAIWTDKGLIYVAKMNSKGELEII